MTDIDLDALEALAEAAAIGDGDLTDMDDVIAAVPALVARVRELEARLGNLHQMVGEEATEAEAKVDAIVDEATDQYMRERAWGIERQAEAADLRARLEAAERERDELRRSMTALAKAVHEEGDDASQRFGKAAGYDKWDAAQRLRALIQSDTGGTNE